MDTNPSEVLAGRTARGRGVAAAVSPVARRWCEWGRSGAPLGVDARVLAPERVAVEDPADVRRLPLLRIAVLVGREELLADVIDCIARERLVTLVGPGDVPVASLRPVVPAGFLIGASADDPEIARRLASAGAGASRSAGR